MICAAGFSVGSLQKAFAQRQNPRAAKAAASMLKDLPRQTGRAFKGGSCSIALNCRMSAGQPFVKDES